MNGFPRMVEKKIFIASKIVYNKRKNRPARNSFLFHRIASTTAANATIILRYSNTSIATSNANGGIDIPSTGY
jgi:hypothetical protein